MLQKYWKWNNCVVLSNAFDLIFKTLNSIKKSYCSYFLSLCNLICSFYFCLQDHCLSAAFWFAILLNLKHIFAYIAPAYIVYLLRNYCFTHIVRNESLKWNSLSIKRCAKLGSVVIFVCLVTYGPFIFYGQMGQVGWIVYF